jgi:hypothetical protein
MPITPWLYYADPLLAPKCRSRAGSNMPVGDSSLLLMLYAARDWWSLLGMM